MERIEICCNIIWCVVLSNHMYVIGRCLFNSEVGVHCKSVSNGDGCVTAEIENRIGVPQTHWFVLPLDI